ncbi:hypothetical protein N7535_003361 [Penicillium sp. DV-2018c]|nr:hypothetical protein N7535_003361 [Penicillium sp. DV-2018c]
MPPTRGKRGPELDPITRAQICELHNTNGWGATTIHKKRFPEIPRSTIQYTLMQESKRQKQESLPRSGKPKKPAEGDRDRDRICETNPTVRDENFSGETSFRSTNRRVVMCKWFRRVQSRLNGCFGLSILVFRDALESGVWFDTTIGDLIPQSRRGGVSARTIEQLELYRRVLSTLLNGLHGHTISLSSDFQHVNASVHTAHLNWETPDVLGFYVMECKKPSIHLI